jgi:hypothetical protein
MTTPLRKDPDFLRYYAGVCMGEARARRGMPFASDLVRWARKARREARALSVPVQPDLFGGMV